MAAAKKATYPAAPSSDPVLDVDDEMADEEEAEGGSDELLGNAFDALQDGDREGFIKSLKAAIGTR